MMSTFKKFLQKVNDIAECPVCKELMSAPKLLPCNHTFCLSCLERCISVNNVPLPKLCPLCRSAFDIPVGGLTSLPNNFSIESLVDVQKYATSCLKKTSCEQHPNKETEVYCRDCKMACCVLCVLENHRTHRCCDYNNDVLEELKSQIKTDMLVVNELIPRVDYKLQKAEREFETFNVNIDLMQAKITQQSEAMHRLIEKSTRALMEELDMHKRHKLKEFEVVKDRLSKQAQLLEYFRQYSQDVMAERAYPVEMARVARDMNTQTKEIKEITDLVLTATKQIDISFVPNNRFLEFAKEQRQCNLIGNITTNLETTPTFINDLKFDTQVNGVAVFDNHILVLLNGLSEIMAYSCNSNMHKSSYSLIGLMDTLDMDDSMSVMDVDCPWDITTIGDHSIFVSEYENSVYRIEFPGEKITRIPVDDKALCLSTTQQNNLLVACSSKLREYTPTGALVREIKLEDDIKNSSHSIHLENDHFLFCRSDTLHQVCLVNSLGKVVKSYGGAPGTGERQLNCPLYLAIDRNKNILVADSNNNRIIQLSPNLEFVKVFIPPEAGLMKPFRLSFDEQCRKLYVAEWYNNRLSVFYVY